MGSQSTNKTEQVLEAMDWYFGEKQCRIITFADDTAGDQTDSYFDLNLIDENYVEQEFYLLLSGTTPAVDPAPAGKTKIDVTYVDGDTATAIAALAKTAIELAGAVKVTLNAGEAIVENSFLGLVTLEDFANAGAITFEVARDGFGGSIGAIAQGGGALSTSQELEDIKSDSTGEIVLDQIMKGSSISLDITLAEMTKENWENLVGEGYGAKEIVGAETLTGFGTSKLYKSAFDFSGLLVGHPIRKDNSDRSADIVIWKCLGNLNTIQYSGSEVQGGEFSFTALKDGTKPSSIDLFARGDHSLL